MDAFIGSWKLDIKKNEGFSVEYGKAVGISEKNFAEYEKMQYTIKVEKAGADTFTYSYCVEGLPEPVVQGPFKLGESFEFFDKFEKRTEVNVFELEGDHTKETTYIKEEPTCKWTLTRCVKDGVMMTEVCAGPHTAKQCYAKV